MTQEGYEVHDMITGRQNTITFLSFLPITDSIGMGSPFSTALNLTHYIVSKVAAWKSKYLQVGVVGELPPKEKEFLEKKKTFIILKNKENENIPPPDM